MPLKTKQAKTLHSPTEAKIPKAEKTPSDNCFIDIRADQMDTGGLWSWKNTSPIKLKEILMKLLTYQKEITWQELREKGSHLVDIKDLSRDAQKRLITIQKDDQDQLYSLRLTGKERIWGIKPVTATLSSQKKIF